MDGPELGLKLVAVAGFEIRDEVLWHHEGEQGVVEVGDVALRIEWRGGSATGKRVPQGGKRSGANRAEGRERMHGTHNIRST